MLKEISSHEGNLLAWWVEPRDVITEGPHRRIHPLPPLATPLLVFLVFLSELQLSTSRLLFLFLFTPSHFSNLTPICQSPSEPGTPPALGPGS